MDNCDKIVEIKFNENVEKEIKKEIDAFRQAYITFDDFESNQINIEELQEKLNEVKKIEIFRKYVLFKVNMLKYIDNISWHRKRVIKKDYLPQIIELLAKLSKTNSDDCAVYAFLLWQGIMIQKNVNSAKE